MFVPENTHKNVLSQGGVRVSVHLAMNKHNLNLIWIGKDKGTDRCVDPYMKMLIPIFFAILNIHDTLDIIGVYP